MRRIAEGTRDPVAAVVFWCLGAAGAAGLIPENVSANTLAGMVGWSMAPVAALFSYLRHRDVKRALQVGLDAIQADATPEPIADDQLTPLDRGPEDAA